MASLCASRSTSPSLLPVSAFQNLINRSIEPETTDFPSGDRATVQTTCSCPRRGFPTALPTPFPGSAFEVLQSLMDLSAEPETIRSPAQAGVNVPENTGPHVCMHNDRPTDSTAVCNLPDPSFLILRTSSYQRTIRRKRQREDCGIVMKRNGTPIVVPVSTFQNRIVVSCDPETMIRYLIETATQLTLSVRPLSGADVGSPLSTNHIFKEWSLDAETMWRISGQIATASTESSTPRLAQLEPARLDEGSLYRQSVWWSVRHTASIRDYPLWWAVKPEHIWAWNSKKWKAKISK